jgi:hypothetical protein
MLKRSLPIVVIPQEKLLINGEPSSADFRKESHETLALKFYETEAKKKKKKKK